MPLGLISVSILQGIQHYKESFILSSFRSAILELLLGFICLFVFHDTLAVYLGIIVGAFLGCLISLFGSQKILNNEMAKSQD